MAAAATSVLSLCNIPALADSVADGATSDSSGVLSGNLVQAPVHLPVNVCGNTVDVIALLNPAFGSSCGGQADEADDADDADEALPDSPGQDDSGDTGSGAVADGSTSGSSGVLSGNTVQVPVDLPVNVCGNTVDVIALLNPAFGSSCGGQADDADDAGEALPDSPGQDDSGDTGSGQTPPGTDDVNTPPAVPGSPAVPPVGSVPAPGLPADQDGPSRANPDTPEGQYDDSSVQQVRETEAVPMGDSARPALARTGSEAMVATSAISAVLIAGGVILYRRSRAAYGR